MGKGRKPCCDKGRVKKGPWSEAEDSRLITFIQTHGHSNWRSLPKLAGLARCGKSCRLRWVNYLRPDVKRGNFAPDEEETILRLHSLLGNKWSKIAAHLPGRTDNEIKNVWNTHLKKRAASEKPNLSESRKKARVSPEESSSNDNGSVVISSSDTTSHNSNNDVVDATWETPCGEPNYADLWDSLLVESETVENVYDLWSYGCSESFELGRIEKELATSMNTTNGGCQENVNQEINKPYQMEGFGGGLDEDLLKMDGNLECGLETMAWEELPTSYGYLGF